MTILGFLLKQIKHIKWLFIIAVVFYLLASTLVQLAPLLIQQTIDGPITDLSKGLPFDETVFLTQSAQYMGMTVLGAIGFYLSMRLLMHCANRIAENLRNQAYDVMQRLPISYFDDKPAGKIATRIVNDTETLRTQFYGTLVYAFNNFVRLVFTYAVLFYMNRSLGWLMLLLIPLYIGISGLIPATGVTFPFLSQGGSSLLTISIGIGFVLNIDATEKRRLIEEEVERTLV
jgi:ATP-binding cassette subfamily B tetracycline resistance protein